MKPDYVKVTLSIFGSSLNTHQVTTSMGIKPTKIRHIPEHSGGNQKRETSDKTIVWQYTCTFEDMSWREALTAFLEFFDGFPERMTAIENVEKVRIGGFVAVSSDQSEGSCEMVIHDKQVSLLAEVGAEIFVDISFD